MKQINWGFIGCGEVTERKSGPAFNLVEGSRVVAVMSRSSEKASSYAQRHNIPRWHTDAQSLINDPEVNAVYIATPPSSHATYAIMAMKAGKPVYVEKPLAASYVDCQRVMRISRETGVPCFVAYYRRKLPYFDKVQELLQDGAIGKVVNVQIRFSVPPRDLDYNSTNLPWRVQRDIAGGGYFYDLAPHQLDLLQEFFGPIVHVSGFSANRGGLYEAEDILQRTQRDTVPNRLDEEYAHAKGNLLLKQQRFEEAIPYIKKGMKRRGATSLDKAREYYLLGQLYTLTGDKKAAYKSFGKTISKSPPYELEFNARIRQTETATDENHKKILRKLKRMARSPKNEEYLSQIYYAIGNIHMSRKDTTEAIKAYETGVAEGSASGYGTGMIHLSLAGIY